MNAESKTPPSTGQTPEQFERLRRIAEQQGTLGTSRLENLEGAGQHLWESEEVFEQFLKLVREIRETKG